MKRLLGMILSAALVITAAVPAYAAESESKQLETVIKAVKSVITVAEDASFSYDTYQTQNGNDTVRLWNLNWEKGKDHIYVSALSDGEITSYYHYNDNQEQEKKGLTSLSREQSQQVAQEFLQKVLPAGIAVADLKLRENWVGDQTTNYIYDLTRNGAAGRLLVKDISFSITVDRYDKTVSNYYSNNLLQYLNAKLPSDSGLIDKAKAESIFLKNNGLKLAYIPVTDYQNKSVTAFVGYTRDDNNFLIDAKTGEVVNYTQYYYIGYDKGGMGSAESASAGNVTLSPAEQAEVSTMKDLMSADEAAKILKNKVALMNKAGKQTGSSFNSDYFSKTEYYWNINFERGNGTVNAKTGEIQSLYYYGDLPESKSGISKEKAESIAQEFIKSVAPSMSEKVQLARSAQDTDTSWTINFDRIENGIGVYGNGMQVSISKANGNIFSLDTSWSNIKSFPTHTDNLGQEGAFKIFDDNSVFAPMYIVPNTDITLYDTEAHAVNKGTFLAYGFEKSSSFMIDPATGKLLDYRGKAYTEEKSGVVGYSDIAGKWYEATVKTLLDNGYYIDSELFEGSKKITQEEFFRYLFAQYQSYQDTDDLYEMLKNMGVIEASEKDPSKVLTRQEAAKFAIRTLGLGKAGELQGIYKKAFNDKIAPQYEGYAALSKALGIMKGDSKGRFNGGNALTRAEAAVIILNTLNAK